MERCVGDPLNTTRRIERILQRSTPASMRAPVGVAQLPLVALADQRQVEVVQVRVEAGSSRLAAAPGHADLELDPSLVRRREFETLDAGEQVNGLVCYEVTAGVARGFGTVLT